MASDLAELSDDDFFRLVAYFAVMWRIGGAHDLTVRLQPEVMRRRPAPKRDTWLAWGAYIVRLILVCPAFLEPLPGFEWVLKDFRRWLENRSMGSEGEWAFWEVIAIARRQMRRGRPRQIAEDIARAVLVEVYRDDRVRSLSAAVGWLAEQHAARTHCAGPDAVGTKTREIWDSLKRARQEQYRLADLLDQCGLPSAHLRSKALTYEAGEEDSNGPASSAENGRDAGEPKMVFSVRLLNTEKCPANPSPRKNPARKSTRKPGKSPRNSRGNRR